MRILLDTHVVLWIFKDDRRLTKPNRALIASQRNDVFVSVASLWEASVKRAGGKLRFQSEALLDRLAANDIRTLAIEENHAFEAGDLPRHHSDPFDRMLIAQAIHEGLRLMTVDSAFDRYEVGTIWR